MPEKTRFHHDVFISYAQQDKPIADAVCAKLETRDILCWIAPRDVPPGKDFPEAIIEGIEGGRIVVVIFSSHANSSPHVIRELTNAVNKSRIIIPFRIEDVEPSKSMEYLISVPHWLDAVTPPLEKHIEVLAKTIDCIIGTEKSPAACLAHVAGEMKAETSSKSAEPEKIHSRCPSCHSPLSPDVKFCESCGAAVAGPLTSPEYTPTDDTLHIFDKVMPAAKAAKSPEPEFVQRPSKISSVVRWGSMSAKHPAIFPSVTMAGLPSRAILGAGIVIVLVIVAALAFQAGAFPPPLAQQTNPSVQGPVAPDYGGLSETDYYQSSDAQVGTVTLTTAPTQTLAKDTELYVDVNKDSSKAIVTVQFNGGPGMGLVRDNQVILTRSDGTVTEGKLNFNQRLSSVQLQGSRGTDRIQVIIILHSGESRIIVDRLLPYRQYR